MDASVSFAEATLTPASCLKQSGYRKKLQFDDSAEPLSVPLSPSTAVTTAPASPASAVTTAPPTPARGGGEGNAGEAPPAEKPELSDDKNIEELRRDLAEAHQLIRTSMADSQAVRFVDRIIQLEADIKVLHEETALWRQRCNDMERDRARAIASEDSTLRQLHESKDRERALAAAELQLRMQQADAGRTHQQAEQEIQAQLAVLRRNDELIRQQDEDIVNLKAQLLVAKNRASDFNSVPLQEMRAALAARDAERSMREASEKAHTEEMSLARAKHNEVTLQVRERIETLEAQVAESSKLRVEAAELRSRNAQLESAMAKLKVEIQVGSEAASLRVRNRQLDEVISKLRMDLQGEMARKDELESVNARNAHLEDLTRQLRSDVQAHVDSSNQMRDLRCRNAHLEELVRQLRSDIQTHVNSSHEIRDLRSRNDQLDLRNRQLQRDLQVQSDEYAQAKFYRAKTDELEETNKQLRSDLEDALSQWATLGVPLGANAARERGRALGVDEGADTSLASTWPRPPPQHTLVKAPVSPPRAMSRLDALRGARSRQLRREVYSARASAAVDAVTRPAVPRNSSRTDAPERYDGDGRLISWDSTGKPI
eukprot:TRINITY_DN27018_c0_g1_i1.p1 TRINITY_DN27018_c0_g1~~TRINITY_DN27018_c0_g1_i1.p1  ORF type:complete len:622 (-),score=134.95 TRINITY_DN27018_c0_g1_i1:254-2053(-)